MVALSEIVLPVPVLVTLVALFVTLLGIIGTFLSITIALFGILMNVLWQFMRNSLADARAQAQNQEALRKQDRIYFTRISKKIRKDIAHFLDELEKNSAENELKRIIQPAVHSVNIQYGTTEAVIESLAYFRQYGTFQDIDALQFRLELEDLPFQVTMAIKETIELIVARNIHITKGLEEKKYISSSQSSPKHQKTRKANAK